MITLLDREQRQGTVYSGSHRDFLGLCVLQVTASMDAPELATTKSLVYWTEYYDHDQKSWRRAGELHYWEGPTATEPSYVVRIPPIEEVMVRVVLDTGTDRINVGATIEPQPYGE